MKLTAVEWLVNEIFWPDQQEKLEKYIEQAKEMEKQQIIDSYSIGTINGEMIERDIKPKYTNPIQYYNDTFNKGQ